MHPKSANKPSQSQLILPLLEEIAQHPAGARPVDVAEALADRFALPSEVREETAVDAAGKITYLWRRHVRYARQKALEMGYVRGDAPGLWLLTDEGQEGVRQAAPGVLVQVICDGAGRPIGAQIELATTIPTVHTLLHGDALSLGFLGQRQIPLILTSVPYFDIVDYGADQGQLAQLRSYQDFLGAMETWLNECLNVLTPGGRLVINVGDVLRSRKRHGKHHVLPLTDDLVVRACQMGFEKLNGIIWNKIGNLNYEQGGAGILGQPGQPNQVIALEYEHILNLRKPGPYRQPTPAQREHAHISRAEHNTWFRQIWSDIPGARSSKRHPCPFPEELPYRIIRMFSFPGDTVVDPFAGSFTTTRAAMRAGRNSVGLDVNPAYVEVGIEQAERYAAKLAA